MKFIHYSFIQNSKFLSYFLYSLLFSFISLCLKFAILNGFLNIKRNVENEK